jgi:hypothetical protein
VTLVKTRVVARKKERAHCREPLSRQRYCSGFACRIEAIAEALGRLARSASQLAEQNESSLDERADKAHEGLAMPPFHACSSASC